MTARQFTKQVRAFRQHNLLTQAMLAEAMGITRRQVAFIESGVNSAGNKRFSYRVQRKFLALAAKYRGKS